MATSVLRPGNTALITGGASGIGLAFASLLYSKHGMNIALVDNNAHNLGLAKGGFPAASSGPGSSGARVQTYEADVSQASAWTSLKQAVLADFGGKLDLLMLNAAVGTRGSWGDSAYFQQTLDVNLMGQVHGLNAFVDLFNAPAGQSSTPKAIVMTGSKQGITNPPGNPAYNASKAAVKALAEHLSYDLRSTPTAVHLLVPGWTFTGLSGGGPGSVTEKPAGAWAPPQVAERLEAAIEKREFWCICPDNDVDEETDRRRMMWSAGDAVHGRPPLSRWRDESKEEAAKWMSERRF